jgi:hypothetical protein
MKSGNEHVQTGGDRLGDPTWQAVVAAALASRVGVCRAPHPASSPPPAPPPLPNQSDGFQQLRSIQITTPWRKLALPWATAAAHRPESLVCCCDIDRPPSESTHCIAAADLVPLGSSCCYQELPISRRLSRQVVRR